MTIEAFRQLGQVHLRYVCPCGHIDAAREPVAPSGQVEVERRHRCSVCLVRFARFVEVWTVDGTHPIVSGEIPAGAG